MGVNRIAAQTEDGFVPMVHIALLVRVEEEVTIPLPLYIHVHYQLITTASRGHVNVILVMLLQEVSVYPTYSIVGIPSAIAPLTIMEPSVVNVALDTCITMVHANQVSLTARINMELCLNMTI